MTDPIFQHTQLLASRSAGVAPCLRLAALVGFLLPLAAGAASAEAATSAPSLGLPDAGSSMLRVLGALIVVFAVFFGLLWLYRNWQRVLKRTGRLPLLNIVEARSLGNRHTLYVVACGEERFLIGSSPTGLNLLSQLPSPETAPAPGAVTDPLPADSKRTFVSFTDTLQGMLERK
jgi:flagellar biosynthetic protein FliO